MLHQISCFTCCAIVIIIIISIILTYMAQKFTCSFSAPFIKKNLAFIKKLYTYHIQYFGLANFYFTINISTCTVYFKKLFSLLNFIILEWLTIKNMNRKGKITPNFTTPTKALTKGYLYFFFLIDNSIFSLF